MLISYIWLAYSALSHKHLAWNSQPFLEGRPDDVIPMWQRRNQFSKIKGPAWGHSRWKWRRAQNSRVADSHFMVFSLVSLASFPDRASLGELNENDALRLKTGSSNTRVPQCSVHHKASLRDSGQLLRGATALWVALESVARSLAGEDTSCSLQKHYWSTE